MKIFQWIRLLGKPLHEYGNCLGLNARRNRITGDVEFVLWKTGEQGHLEDYWHRFGLGAEQHFKPHNIKDNK